MSKLINAKINFSKIDKDRIFKGQTGDWLDLSIWINDKPDQYGNDVSIEQKTNKDEKKIYLGNGKFYVKKEDPLPDKQGQYQGGKPALTKEDILNAPDDDKPF